MCGLKQIYLPRVFVSGDKPSQSRVSVCSGMLFTCPKVW